MRLDKPAKSCASLGAVACFLASLAPAARGESVAALAEKGNALYKQERLQDAIDLYRDAIAREPESPLIQYNLGTALSRDQKYDEAAKILQQAAQTPSQYSGDASFNLGVTRAESILKNHPQVQQFLKASPSTDAPIAPQLASAVDPKGVKESVDQLQDALGSFRQSVVKTPGSSEAKYNYEVTRQMIDRLKQLQQVQQQQSQQSQDQKKQDQQQPSQDPQQKKQNQDQKDKDQQSQNQQGQKQNQDPQKQDDKSDPKQQDKGQDGKGQPQATPTPAPQPTAPPKAQDSKSGDNGDSGQKPAPTPPPSQDSGGEGSDAKPQMNPDQMDAMRLLQLLESDKPEQFKKLFQFQGKLRQNQSGKDW